MNDIWKSIWKKLRQILNSIKSELDATISNSFPTDTERKRFYFTVIAMEVLIFYGIAVLDMGVWKSVYTPIRLIAAYISVRKMYPFALFLVISIVFLVAAYSMLSKQNNGNTGRGFDISDSNVYGSAREINMKELQKIADVCPKEKAIGTILGQLDTTGKRLITTKPLSNFNKNMLALAPPGSGKTFCIVLNSIIQAILRGESVIATDTKGEVFAKTVEPARRYGYLIRRFDLKNPQFSDGWDVLGEIQHDDTRAKIAANTIMRNTSDAPDIHAAAEESLLVALCLYVDLNPDFPPEERNLFTVYNLLAGGITQLDNLFNSIKDDETLHVAFHYYANFMDGSPNLRGNIVTNLGNRLSKLTSPTNKNLISTPDIDLTLPGKRKCIYYVELPDQHNSMRPLSSLFFSFLFWDLCDFADRQPTQKLPVPVNCMIEEAFACGEIPTLPNALATVRSRDISITLIAQGLNQFHLLYGEEMTDTILECCATYICLGTNTQSTASLFRWLSGTATVKVKTEQHSFGESPFLWGKRYSSGDGRQDLYSENDIRKIPFGRILLVWQRFDPILAYTFGINEHPEFVKGHMPQVNAATTIPLSDTEAKAYFRAAEEQRIMEYEKWVTSGGDIRKDEPPTIKSYPELEKEALDYSKQAAPSPAPDPYEILDAIQNDASENTYQVQFDIQWDCDNFDTDDSFSPDMTDVTDDLPAAATNTASAPGTTENTDIPLHQPHSEPQTKGQGNIPPHKPRPAPEASRASAQHTSGNHKLTGKKSIDDDILNPQYTDMNDIDIGAPNGVGPIESNGKSKLFQDAEKITRRNSD